MTIIVAAVLSEHSEVQVHLTPKHLGLVLELAPEGDLFQYIQAHGSLTEAAARRIFQQVKPLSIRTSCWCAV